MRGRSSTDLTPVDESGVQSEVRPLIQATGARSIIEVASPRHQKIEGFEVTEGVVHVHGTAVPIVDLRRLLPAGTPPRTAKPKVILARIAPAATKRSPIAAGSRPGALPYQ